MKICPMGFGVWGWGMEDWGLWIGPNPQCIKPKKINFYLMNNDYLKFNIYINSI